MLRSGVVGRCRIAIAMAALGLVAAWPAAAEAQVAARAIARGTVLTAEDILTTPHAEQQGHEVAVGWVARRRIAEGEALRAPAVAPPRMVESGQPVRVTYTAGGVELSMRGTALGSAAAGERVLVRIDARRRMEGIAVAAGVVSLEDNGRRSR
jgi:flagellar basal body P-ring formation protein FlgA